MIIQILVAIISGFFGALLNEYLISPIRGFRNTRLKISKDLVKYGDVIGNPGSPEVSQISEAKTELRTDAAKLHAIRDELPRPIFHLPYILPSEEEIESAEKSLIRLSNTVQGIDIDSKDDVELANSDRQEVRDGLGLSG
ncbi:hypothetical protein [Halobacterium salinarum]|uniref:Uncharacterized protein n=4 Tax=Halobacterium salinarum TaxID=2242 RepID=Q9HNR7_HALSA|nr:hypothetical protein [Halobacterium salinarum]AAG20153.1 hypothetical protein VNG_1978H [Halobacterium salinarum NRC-1]MBB6089166.1 hypothetical protein [Halobacterium salinarum]MDL0118742.1 hypothetical protein [Halobacterium salinarum]MDL0124396.1 hypothetical protein [Halobacterium salinarum]MDL0130455.1 hypothetical protein [Halobacterium salinarum]